MNHKDCLRLYGVRRTLKWRRRRAREDNRQAAAIVKGEKWWRGRHTRWTTEGNAELLFEMFGDPDAGGRIP